MSSASQPSHSYPSATHSLPARQRLERVLNPTTPLTRDDVVWTLDYIRQKMAEGKLPLQQLPQPQLIAHFQAYAEIALMLLHPQSLRDQEDGRLKQLLREASFGLLPDSRKP